MTEPTGAESAPFHETEGVELSEIERGQGYVAIVNLGSQTHQNIYRFVEELGLKPVMVEQDYVSAEDLQGVDAVILSGGDGSVYDDEGRVRLDDAIFGEDYEQAVLGICLGMQEIALRTGGLVEKGTSGQYGEAVVQRKTEGSRILLNLDSDQPTLMSHGDEVVSVGDGFEVTGVSDGKIAIIENTELNLYGVQFHPEQDLTENGKQIIGNFLRYGAFLEVENNAPDLAERAKQNLLKGVGTDGRLMIGASGGVDSTALTTLAAHEMGPERLRVFNIDHGAMRRVNGVDESDLVMEMLRGIVPHAERFDLAKEFLNTAVALKISHETGEPAVLTMRDVLHAEDKRAVFKGIYGPFFQKIRAESGDDFMIGQGTLYTDIAESGKGGKTNKIKSHHNVGVFKDGDEVLPFSSFFKDQVRAIARELGVPEEFVMRQPFPGPGLFLRIICADRPYLPSDAEFLMSQVQLIGENDKGLGYGLLPVRTVGQQGDERTYENSHAISLSFDDGRMPDAKDWELITEYAQSIPQGEGLTGRINRTIFLPGEPIAGIVDDVTPTRIGEDTLELAKEADDLALSIFRRHGLEHDIAQSLVAILPTPLGEDGKRTAVFRGFMTKTWTDGRAAIPGRDFPLEIFSEELVPALSSLEGVGRVGIDITGKPPGTTEFE